MGYTYTERCVYVVHVCLTCMCDVRQSVTVTGKMNGEPYIHSYIDRVMKVIVMGKMYQNIPAVVCS